jgi:hypothetical protein
MPMTREERCELLKLAREAKQKKKENNTEEPVVKKTTRGRKKTEPVTENPTDDIMEEDDTDKLIMDYNNTMKEIDTLMEDKNIEEPVKKLKGVKKEPSKTLNLEMDDNEPDVIYETEYRKKPKKKIVKRIIYEDDSDDSVEEVVIDNRKKKTEIKQVKPVSKPKPLPTPKQPELKQPSFNFFNC